MLFKNWIKENWKDENEEYVKYEFSEIGRNGLKFCICKIDGMFYNVDLGEKFIENESDSFDGLCLDNGWLNEVNIEDIDKCKICEMSDKVRDRIMKFDY